MDKKLLTPGPLTTSLSTKQAMLHDPLVAAVCNPEEVWQMTDEMLVAQAQWLPNYKDEIPKAKERLKHRKPIGNKETEGAARLKTKSVEELRAAGETERILRTRGE